METVIIILAILAGLIGIAGSILPGLPGAPFSWIGLLLLFLWGPEEVPAKALIIWGAVVVLVSIIDYVVPMYFTKVTGGSRYAERGAMAGLIIGIILTPVGMIFSRSLPFRTLLGQERSRGCAESSIRLLPGIHNRHRSQDHSSRNDDVEDIRIRLLDISNYPAHIFVLLLHALEELVLCMSAYQIVFRISDLVIFVSIDVVHQETEHLLESDISC